MRTWSSTCAAVSARFPVVDGVECGWVAVVSLVKSANDLSVEERNLLSVGYKNCMSVRRTAFRTTQSRYEQDTSDEKVEQAKLDELYIQYIREEVFGLIKEVSEEVVYPYVQELAKDDKLTEEQSEVLVFFKKMEGDYNRYGAEITSGDKRGSYKDAAQQAYQEANKFSENLASTNPISLGLSLNFSVFYYEICDMKPEATSLAQNAFESAIDHLDTLEDEEYKDSTLIMQLLKDNLTLWNTPEQESDDIQVEDCEQ
eukprot:TRINITY_DN51_c0_g1_i7.p1 TRINITY_DN51_c0_g1~~TRINITY_DN51_c0_g1_i7.p1  ORF type:complete len:257 (-),score=71.19 TRINITY_DN51_c0_g1_i7:215-985(-)